MKVNLCVIATAKYTQFLSQFLESAERFFLKGHDVHYCIFTDWNGGLLNVEMDGKGTIFPVEHKPWPHATLKRFHFFLEHKDNLPDADYFFYCDVDSRFVAPIGDEILSKRTAVLHCGYIDGQNLPFENNVNSCAYVPESKRVAYYGGGFWGFEGTEFLNVSHYCAQAIDFDEENSIIPVWHDESILNKYLAACPPTLTLSPSYHYPENHPHIYGKWARQGVSFEPKILLLNKDHTEIRND